MDWDTPLNIDLYLFDYKPELQALAGLGGQFGVMGDEATAVGLKGGGYAFGELQPSELRDSGNTPLRAPGPLI